MGLISDSFRACALSIIHLFATWSMPVSLPSFQRQQLLLEFAAIKSKCPPGIYLAPEAGNAAKWPGVLFVRQGPYASAILRFELAFPIKYPEIGPMVTFSTEIFHPLLVPLTTYTFDSGALDPNTTFSSSETERLAPGSFNLREGFPRWYPRSTRNDDRSARSSSTGTSFATEAAKDKEKDDVEQHLQAVLEYMRRAFEDVEFLDNLSLKAAVNTNAWHAWRAHRGLPKLGSRSTSPASAESGRTPQSPGRMPGDWNWDGVWESRARNGTEESTSDALLFGSKTTRTANQTANAIRFTKNDDGRTQEIQESMIKAMGLERA